MAFITIDLLEPLFNPNDNNITVTDKNNALQGALVPVWKNGDTHNVSYEDLKECITKNVKYKLSDLKEDVTYKLSDLQETVNEQLEELGQAINTTEQNAVKLTGNQTVGGIKTFSTSPAVPNKTATATNNGTL